MDRLKNQAILFTLVYGFARSSCSAFMFADSALYNLFLITLIIDDLLNISHLYCKYFVKKKMFLFLSKLVFLFVCKKSEFLSYF